MTEADWQKQVIELARLFKWRVAHFRPAQTKHGWVTPVAADGKGFPDLVLVRERVIYAELKAETGKASDDQITWGLALQRACQEIYIWRPSEWEDVVATLRRRAPQQVECGPSSRRVTAGTRPTLQEGRPDDPLQS